MSISEFNFERLMAPPLASLIPPSDEYQLFKYSTSLRYSSKPLEKLKAIDYILKCRGFRKLTGGTNRVVYKFLENDDIVIKVATDNVGNSDNPREYQNQNIYKPFITKVFEVSPHGTVGLFERVVPITSREEFLSIASDVYDVISNWFVGEFVMDDIGSEYFMNWGIRRGFGPVLLDFPYAYKLDGNKLYCNVPLIKGQDFPVCGGVIDYDDGFNHLRCTKCGAPYKAIELKKAIEMNSIIVRKERSSEMKVSVGYVGGPRYVTETPEMKEVATIKKFTKKGPKSKTGTLTVKTNWNGHTNVTKSDDKKLDIDGIKRGEIKVKPYYRVVTEEEMSDIIRPTRSEDTSEREIVAKISVDKSEASSEDVVEVSEKAEQITESVEESTDIETRPAMEVDDVIRNYVVGFDGAITNVREILHNNGWSNMDLEDVEEKKCIVITVPNDDMYVADADNNVYIIEAIDGKPIEDLAFLEVGAMDKIYDTLSANKERIKELEDKIKSLEEEIKKKDEEAKHWRNKFFQEASDTPSDKDQNVTKSDEATPVKQPAKKSSSSSKKTNKTERVMKEILGEDQNGDVAETKEPEQMEFDTSSPYIPEEVEVPVGAAPVTQDVEEPEKPSEDTPKPPAKKTTSKSTSKKKK